MSENKKLKLCNVEEDSGDKPTDPKSVDQGTNNADEDLMQVKDGMPTLVAKIFIESTTDIELLKKCRFINKYWNFEACAALRKLSVVKFSGGINELIGDFLTVQAENKTSLPSPFKHAQVFAMDYQEIFHDRILTSGLEIKRFSVRIDGGEGLERVRRLLKAKEGEITELEITGHNINDLHVVFSEVQLSALHTLSISGFTCWVSDHNCDHVELIKRVTMGLPLSSLKIDIFTASCFTSFLSLNLTRMRKLRLFIEKGLRIKFLDELAAVKFPSLKYLHIDTKEGCDERYFQQLCRLYTNVSSTIESLEVFSCNILGRGVYPKLKNLSSYFYRWEELKNISPNEFPSLEVIKIRYFNLSNFVEAVPHEGVQKLGACITTSNRFVIGEDGLFATRVAVLAEKFPNVKHLHIDLAHPIQKWTSPKFANVYQAYPHLKFLKLHGIVPLEVWAGATMEELNAEGPAQNFPRMVSIMDFQSLESLVIKRGGSISNESIQYCLARIPNLKSLKFPWSEGLSVQVVSNSLQHLYTLEISNSYDWRTILPLLRTVMPRTVIKGQGKELT